MIAFINRLVLQEARNDDPGHPVLRPRIRRFRAAGYRVELIYLRPPSADFSVARVARRVA